MFLELLLIYFVISAVLSHYLAKRRGLNPVLWGVLGACLGVVVIPFIFHRKPPD